MGASSIRRMLAVSPADLARVVLLGILAQAVPSRFSGGHSAVWSHSGIPFTYLVDTVVLNPVSGQGIRGGGPEFDALALAANLGVVVLLGWAWLWVATRCVLRAGICLEPCSYALMLLINLLLILRSWTSSGHGSAAALDFFFGFPYRHSPLPAEIPQHWMTAFNLSLIVVVATAVELLRAVISSRRGAT